MLLIHCSTSGSSFEIKTIISNAVIVHGFQELVLIPSLESLIVFATYDLDLKFMLLVLSLLLCCNTGQSTRRMLKHTTIEAAA